MKEAFYIFLAGGAGSVLRYGVQLLMHERIHPYHFPWATLTANVAGCFFIGLFYALSARLHLSAEVRLLLTTGLCGGFTTLSTFCNENLALLRQGYTGTFALYVGLSLALGICAVWAGSTLLMKNG